MSIKTPIDDCEVCNRIPFQPQDLQHVLDHLVEAGLVRRSYRTRGVKETTRQ